MNTEMTISEHVELVVPNTDFIDAKQWYFNGLQPRSIMVSDSIIGFLAIMVACGVIGIVSSTFSGGAFSITFAIALVLGIVVGAAFYLIGRSISKHFISKHYAKSKKQKADDLIKIVEYIENNGWKQVGPNHRGVDMRDYFVTYRKGIFANNEGIEYQLDHMGIFLENIKVMFTLSDRDAFAQNKAIRTSNWSVNLLDKWEKAHGMFPTDQEREAFKLGIIASERRDLGL